MQRAKKPKTKKSDIRGNEPQLQLASKALKIKNLNDMNDFLREVMILSYAQGANAVVLKENERWLKVEYNTSYECICPECGAELELNLIDLVEEVL